GARRTWQHRRGGPGAGRGRRPASARRPARAAGACRRSQRAGGRMSRWLFDLGNSRLKFAPLQDGRAGPVTAIAHDGHRFADGWDALLPVDCTRAFVSSVGPTPLLEQLRMRLFERGAEVERARTEAACDGVRIAYGAPSRLGVDRFLALLAAHAWHEGHALVVGVGTALTID